MNKILIWLVLIPLFADAQSNVVNVDVGTIINMSRDPSKSASAVQAARFATVQHAYRDMANKGISIQNVEFRFVTRNANFAFVPVRNQQIFRDMFAQDIRNLRVDPFMRQHFRTEVARAASAQPPPMSLGDRARQIIAQASKAARALGIAAGFAYAYDYFVGYVEAGEHMEAQGDALTAQIINDNEPVFQAGEENPFSENSDVSYTVETDLGTELIFPKGERLRFNPDGSIERYDPDTGGWKEIGPPLEDYSTPTPTLTDGTASHPVNYNPFSGPNPGPWAPDYDLEAAGDCCEGSISGDGTQYPSQYPSNYGSGSSHGLCSCAGGESTTPTLRRMGL